MQLVTPNVFDIGIRVVHRITGSIDAIVNRLDEFSRSKPTLANGKPTVNNFSMIFTTQAAPALCRELASLLHLGAQDKIG